MMDDWKGTWGILGHMPEGYSQNNWVGVCHPILKNAFDIYKQKSISFEGVPTLWGYLKVCTRR